MTREEVVTAIVFEGMCRRQLHSAEKRLALQIKAILRHFKPADRDEVESEEEDPARTEALRRPVPSSPSLLLDSALGPVLTVLEDHRLSLKKSRRVPEKRLAALAEQLPAWTEWVSSVRGISPLGLALVIAETGDLANYANVAKVWKRLGLAVIGGERQRRVTDVALAKAMGYNPRRRSVAWNVGGSFIKQGEHYRDLYLARKTLEAAKPPCGKTWKSKAGKTVACEKDGHCRPRHIEARASRWMVKKFIAHLWGAWNHRAEPVHQSAA